MAAGGDVGGGARVHKADHSCRFQHDGSDTNLKFKPGTKMAAYSIITTNLLLKVW